jgi:hypothetical protein
MDPEFELRVMAQLMKLIFSELVRLRQAEYRVKVQLSRFEWYNKEAKAAVTKRMVQ